MDTRISRRAAVGSISAAALSLFGARLGFTEEDEVKPLRFAVFPLFAKLPDPSQKIGLGFLKILFVQ